MWFVKTNNQTITLELHDLFELLLEKVTQTEKHSHRELVAYFLEYLEAQSILKGLSFLELAYLAFNLGYRYRIFLEKNEVEYEQPVSESNEP